MAVKTFDPKKLRITWGPIIFSGFGDEMVSVEYPEDVYDVVRGADGQVTRVRKSVDDVQITVTLKQSSETNPKLSVLLKADANSGAGILPFTIADGSPSGTTFLFADSAFIKKAPTVDFGNTVKDRVWVFHTGPCGLFIGGN